MRARFTILPHHFTPRRRGTVQLRHLPYPYKGALSICNDIDDCGPELFTLVHQVLSTTGDTPIGPGLGLEIGDSVFVWSHDDAVISLLDGNGKPTRWAEPLMALCRNGWIDCLHGMGDFNSAGGFNRQRAKEAYRFLTGHDIRIPVWTNHGNTNNIQNFYARHRPSCIGDLPGQPAYHHDLAIAYGLTRYWWHELSRYPLSNAHPDRMETWRRILVNETKNVAKTVLGQWKRRMDRRILTRLALPVSLRSGRKCWAFTRYNADAGGHVWKRNPGRHTIAHQLSEDFLEKLKRQQGYAVIYTHFAQPAWQEGEPVFDAPNMRALTRLKAYQRRGDILVATTSRLLSYWVCSHFLEWRSVKRQRGVDIHISGVNDPVSGWNVPLPEELMGLSFYTPCPEHTRVFLNNEEVTDFLPFAPDLKGRGGVHFPWRALPPPENFFRLSS